MAKVELYQWSKSSDDYSLITTVDCDEKDVSLPRRLHIDSFEPITSVPSDLRRLHMISRPGKVKNLARLGSYLLSNDRAGKVTLEHGRGIAYVLKVQEGVGTEARATVEVGWPMNLTSSRHDGPFRSSTKLKAEAQAEPSHSHRSGAASHHHNRHRDRRRLDDMSSWDSISSARQARHDRPPGIEPTSELHKKRRMEARPADREIGGRGDRLIDGEISGGDGHRQAAPAGATYSGSRLGSQAAGHHWSSMGDRRGR